MNVQQVDRNSVCRFCLEKVVKPNKTEEEDKILAKINFILHLEIFQEDVWPKRICASCKQKSKDCIAFYRSIREAEEKLLDLTGEKFQELKKEVVFLEELPLDIKEEILEGEETNFPEGEEDTKSSDNEKDDEASQASSKSPSWAPSSAEESEDDEEVEEKPKTPKKKPTEEEGATEMIQEQSQKAKVQALNNDVVRDYLGFKCDICSTEAKSYQSLKHHFLHEHGVKGYIICCSKKFTELGRLASHVKIHINPEAFKCPKCSKVYGNSISYAIHRKECSAAPETPTIICKVCSKAFLSTRQLNFHRRREHLTEEEKPHKCPDCSKRFLVPSALKYHKMWVHENRKLHLCDTCGLGFQNQSGVKEHIKRTHLKDQQPKHKCKHCGRAFIEVRLKEHLRFCNVPPVACDLCGKKLKNSSMHSHMRKQHKGFERKTFTCHICSKTLSAKAKLTDHIAKHQGIALRECSFCDKKFYSLSAQSLHQRKQHPAENAAAKKIPKT